MSDIEGQSWLRKIERHEQQKKPSSQSKTKTDHIEVYIISTAGQKRELALAMAPTPFQQADDSSFSGAVVEFWDNHYVWIAAVLAIVLVIIIISITLCVYSCVRKRRKKAYLDAEKGLGKGGQVCLYPTVLPTAHTTTRVQPKAGQYSPAVSYSRSQTQSVKQKGLLERRGSNASLTIDLTPNPSEQIKCGTPPKEGSAEEYLLSAGHRMTKKELTRSVKNLRALHDEFFDIPLNHYDNLDISGCGIKNRYRTILPNPHSRVLLLTDRPEDPLSAYINSNYIRGYDESENSYIATQGPMPHTFNDFWLMVWNEQSPVIVMITNLRERNKVKCDKYWPEVSETYGDINVAVVECIARDGYNVSYLMLTNKVTNETHAVVHYWYTAWPDHRAPESARQLVEIVLDVLEYTTTATDVAFPHPVVVHCSAGIGRTGCFIAMSIGVQQLREEGMVDILGIVCQMRRDRGGMVQTIEQYEFVHRALCQYVKMMDRRRSSKHISSD